MNGRSRGVILLALTASQATFACDEGGDALFACDAANSTKYIELCASGDLHGEDGALQYRFGKLDEDGTRGAVELAYPEVREGSLEKFHGSVYHDAEGVYVQSVRFENAGYSYTVFTQAQGMEELGAGVRVRNVKTGKVTTIDCSERPRFYIFELEGVLACDPATPVGKACIE